MLYFSGKFLRELGNKVCVYAMEDEDDNKNFKKDKN